MSTAPHPAWADAVTAAALFAVDPSTGVVLRARAGPVRERWLMLLRELLPAVPIRTVPLNITDGRLLGGLDLTATLQAGRPVAERGLLAEANGGIVQLAMAERMSAGTAARIGAVLDAGEVLTTRDGIALRDPARFGAVALDEGIDDEHAPVALLDRLAFHLSLDDIGCNETFGSVHDAGSIADARTLFPQVNANTGAVEALCAATVAFGIMSARAALLALRVARAAAALDGREAVSDDDVTLAARLVLAPRATVIPAMEPQPEEDQQSPSEGDDDTTSEKDREAQDDRPLDDIVLAAVKAAIPAGLLSELKLANGGRARSRQSGKAGVLQKSVRHGRPVGAHRGELRAGARLNVIETLRAAAPWQAIRRREALRDAPVSAARVQVRREDFRITRFKQRAETTTIFVVDASGSSALHRLAEAKGAVELLLADCYVRRDQVALIAFRGKSAELLLPPTRSLVRAKRSLAGLPGGGGTPLAAALDAAGALADSIKRKGQTPIVILLTDGRANVARDGGAGRERAAEDALASARLMRAAGFTALLVDTSPQPQAAGAKVAAEMGARYLPLPLADAAKLSQAVLAATQYS